MLLENTRSAGGTHSNYGTHTLYGQGLNLVRLYARTSTAKTGRSWTLGLTTPTTQPLPGITRDWFSPIRFRSPLLTESLTCFLFLPVLRCFTSRRSLQHAYTFSVWSHTTTACGVSPFGNPGLNARLSAPPGLSQIPTSFIGSCYQGIHHAPFNTYTFTKLLKNKRCSRPLCSSQTTTPTPITTTHKREQQLPEAEGPVTGLLPEDPTAHQTPHHNTHQKRSNHSHPYNEQHTAY